MLPPVAFGIYLNLYLNLCDYPKGHRAGGGQPVSCDILSVCVCVHHEVMGLWGWRKSFAQLGICDGRATWAKSGNGLDSATATAPPGPSYSTVPVAATTAAGAVYNA